MKLFNNLRRRLIHKLIRPEDGYTYTGASVRFYCDIEDQYVLQMNNRYLLPVLTGWKDYDGEENDLEEITFHQWMIGILSNITNQYFERLDNLSQAELKSIRDYKLQEKGEGFVITKKAFCDIMDALEHYWDNLGELEDILKVQFCGNILTEIFDSVVNALEDELEPQFSDPNAYFDIDEDPLLTAWMFNCNDIRMKGIDGHSLATVEELYDYLVWKRENNLEKSSETP